MRRRVEVLTPSVPAVVLGSTQAAPVGPSRIEVVRRRTGGGAVLVTPDDPLWVDVDLPIGDPLWSDDVGASFRWLGAAWTEALGHGIVHEGGFEPGRWGRTVCFAGRGPGEVFVDGAKVVGLAQRRTRAGARFQCAVLSRWAPDALIDVVVPGEDRAAARPDLAGVARGVPLDGLLDRFLEVLAGL